MQFDRSKVRVHYLRDLATIRPKLPSKNEKLETTSFTRGNPVGCIVSFVDKENDVIYFQYAISHPKDCFVKQRAVQIATGRLDQKPWIIQGVPSSKHEIYAKIVSYIVKNSEFLSNVRKASREEMEKAKKWHISAKFHLHANAWLTEYKKMQLFKEKVLTKLASNNIIAAPPAP
jgi:hypothetical protein